MPGETILPPIGTRFELVYTTENTEE